jgi:LysM repeat protein
MRVVRAVVTLLGVGAALVLGACGGDDDPNADETLPAMQTTAPPFTTAGPSTTAQPRFHEVKSGDTLTAIAATYGLPVEAIMIENNLTDPNRIVVGQVLILPLMADVTTTTTAAVTTVPQATAAPVITTIAP